MSIPNVPEGKRYSALDRDEVHKDMGIDPAITRRNVAAQPKVAEAHRECEVCAEMLPEGTPVPLRIGVIERDFWTVAQALDLPPGYRVLRMYVLDGSQSLRVVVESEELPEIESPDPPFLQF